MAVTIHDTPELYTPSDNPVRWTFSSDQTAQTNFIFVIKVFINDAEVANELVSPDNGIYGRYDASSWTSLNCTAPIITQDIVLDAANYCDVRITVTERYGEPPADQASSAASNITAFKAKMTDDDFIDWVAADYILGSSSSKWLSSLPSFGVNASVRREDESIRIMAINDAANINILIQLYDSSDVLINSDTYGFAGAGIDIVIANITPSIIITETSITSGDFDSAAYYVVSDTDDMTTFRIDIDTSCVYDRYKRIHFLSLWGTVESYSFGLVSARRAKIKSFSYKPMFGQWNGSSFDYTKTQGRIKDFSKVVETMIDVESNWVPQETQHWLVQNLYASILVWEEDLSDGTLLERKITKNGYRWMYRDNNQLFKEKIILNLPSFTTMTL